MIKKVIILPDIHYPYQDKPSLKAVESFMPEFKPDYLVYLGDQVDLAMVREMLHKKRAAVTKGYIIDHYSGFDEIMTGHQEMLKNAQFVFMEGNHEERIRRLLDETAEKFSEGRGIALISLVRFKVVGITAKISIAIKQNQGAIFPIPNPSKTSNYSEKVFI